MNRHLLWIGTAALLAACSVDAEPEGRAAATRKPAPPTASAPAPDPTAGIVRAPSQKEQIAACRTPEPDGAALQAQLQAGRYAELEDALAAFERAYDADPNCEPHVWISIEAVMHGERAPLDAWVAARPDSWMPWTARAGHLLDSFTIDRLHARDLGDEEAERIRAAIEGASGDLDRALALRPDGLVTVGLAVALQRFTGDAERIFALLDTLAARDPLAVGARLRAANVFATRFGAGVEPLRRVAQGAEPYLERNPRLRMLEGFVEAELGVAAWGQRDHAAAADHYRRALAYSEQPNWFDDLGQMLDQLKAYAEMESRADAYVQRWPDFAVGYLWRGNARLSLRRPAEALPDLERAAADLPNHRYVRMWRGLALEHLGRLEEAAAAYEEVLALAPNQKWTRERLAKVRELLAAADAAPRMPGLALLKEGKK
jgi:tetratricopeptide (TPR) repeat protein